MSAAPLPLPGEAAAAPPGVAFRPAGPDDAEAVARVHFEAARQAYRGILPDVVLADMTYERRLALWGGLLGGPGKRPRVELAVEPAAELAVGGEGAGPDRAVAFAWWRDTRDAEAAFDGEIVALYVLPHRQRQGLGRRLMAHSAERMAAAGLKSCYLWAFEDHRAARRFYARLGGRPVDRDWETLDQLRVARVAYAWKPIDALLAQGTAGEAAGRAGAER